MDDATTTANDNEARALAGLQLRSAIVVLLLDRGGPMSVPELVAGIRRSGFELEGRASKAVSDALRWEVGRGRVVRVRRGIYAAGRVAKVTRHRMRARVAATRRRATAMG